MRFYRQLQCSMQHAARCVMRLLPPFAVIKTIHVAVAIAAAAATTTTAAGGAASASASA